MMSLSRLLRSLRLILLGVLLLRTHHALAHEGHEALPTKGATVRGNTVLLSQEAIKALGLTTAEIYLGTLQNTVAATTTVATPWQQHAFVTTKVGGKIRGIHFRVGDQVKRADILAEVESLELANQQLELIQYKLELDLARKTLARAEALGQAGIVAGKEVNEARSTEIEKNSALEITKQKLLAIGLSDEALSQVITSRQPIKAVPIVAPIGGTITEGDVNPGQIVEPTEHLFEIMDLSRVYARVMIVEADSHRIKVGQQVRVSMAGIRDKSFLGRINRISDKADPTTRVLPAWVWLSNANPAEPVLRPGMFGSARVVVDEVKEAIICPRAAIVTAGADNYVFVDQAPGQYLKKSVVLGMQTPELVELKEGTFPGDRVVIRGAQQLSTFFIQGVLELTPETKRNIGLKLAKAQPRVLEKVLTINAVVEVPPDRLAFASSLVDGNVAQIHVDFSQQVKRGQILASIESLQFQESQLELLQTEARLKLAEGLLKSARKANNTLAEQQILQRETDYLKLQNELDVQRGKLLTIGLARSEIEELLQSRRPLRTFPVRSPLDGTVVSFDIVPGQVIRSTDRLFEIHDLRKVWVRGHLFEQDFQRLGMHQNVRIRLTSDPTFLAEAMLVRSNPMLNSVDRVMPVWAELENPQRKLKHNMLAEMTISTGKMRPALAVPKSAIVTEGRHMYVFVQHPRKPDRFERRPIVTAKSDDRYVQIQHGLRPGEVVAVDGVQELRSAFASLK